MNKFIIVLKGGDSTLYGFESHESKSTYEELENSAKKKYGRIDIIGRGKFYKSKSSKTFVYCLEGKWEESHFIGLENYLLCPDGKTILDLNI